MVAVFTTFILSWNTSWTCFTAKKMLRKDTKNKKTYSFSCLIPPDFHLCIGRVREQFVCLCLYSERTASSRSYHYPDTPASSYP